MANIDGGSGRDILDGTIFQDTIRGFGGNDDLLGKDADDLLQGGSGNDHLEGGDGDDLLEGAEDNDELFGGDGDDEVFGGLGDDRISGGHFISGTWFDNVNGGRDSLFGGGGNDSIEFSWEDAVVDGGADDDIIEADPSRQTSIFEGQIDQVLGGSGIDTFMVSDNQNIGGGRRAMTANLNTGEVTVTFDYNSDNQGNLDFFTTTLVGIENLKGGYTVDDLTGDDKDNILTGMGGADVLNGNGGNDTLIDHFSKAGEAVQFGSNVDEMHGGAGDDEIHSTGGDDQAYGDGGDDVFHVTDIGGVTIDGGSDVLGDELVLYESVPAQSDGANYLLGDNGAVTGIERLTLKGTGGNHVTLAVPLLNSASGNAFEVTGAGGNDIVDGSRAESGVALQMNGRDGGDQLTGGDGADNLQGGGNSDTLDGGAGTDTLDGGKGDDVLLHSAGVDTFLGGGGSDTVDFSTAEDSGVVGLAAVTVDIASGTATTGGLFAVVDTLSSVENATGSAFDDILRGGGGDNSLSGGKGADVLEGRDGNDFLYGNKGADTLRGGRQGDIFDGGAGNDTADFSAADNAITIFLDVTTAQATGEGNDAFISIERIIGSAFGDSLKGSLGDDTLEGGDGDDVLEGSLGRDTLNGGAGENDTVSYASSGGAVTLDLSITAFQDTGFNGEDRIRKVENVIGSITSDDLTGSAKNNQIDGAGGADTIEGGDGQDTLTGGSQADSFVYADIADSGPFPDEYDFITDFAAGQDKLDLSKLYNDFSLTFSLILGNFSETDLGEVKLVDDGAGGTFVKLNLTADEGAEMVIQLLGVDRTTISESDFLV